MFIFATRKEKNNMSYSEMAQLELMNALNSIDSEAELNEFKDLVARYFAEKAQKCATKGISKKIDTVENTIKV